MSLTAGTRIGPFLVKSSLGEGGMGVVFRALDTKLQREVALKLLPDHFADDPERLARFQREAQVLASLNHPNIAQIYGLEESDSARCIVMELVEGETLQERLKRGPIPMDEALPIAKQIAEALEAAHERGIVHRDLKPANIKLTPNGKVKVLDFGLAKAFQEHQATTLSNSPTLVGPSVPGIILGTAAYMSPEQAKGKEADRTSDVWAFGCLLYEVLTGHAVFEGETTTEILGAVLRGEPDWRRLPAETPDAIRRLLRRCLQKDRGSRLQHIGDARIEINEAASASDLEGDLTRTVAKQRLAWIAASVSATLIVAVFGVWAFRSPAPAPAAEVRLEINTPPPAADELAVSLAISPDGEKIVFAAAVEGRSQLWLRPLSSDSAKALAGTEGAIYPFWSPDSHSIGFFAEGQLKRIDIAGGAPQPLANAPVGRGGAWNRDGVILFTPNNSGPIFRISATGGGEPAAVTRMSAGQQNHRFAQFLPDGRHFIYFVLGTPEANGIFASALDGSDNHRVMDVDSTAIYTSGQMLSIREGTLFAQKFDPAQLALGGNPTAIAERAFAPYSATPGTGGAIGASASSNGAIIYRSVSAARQRQFIWYDRSGKEIEKVGNTASNGSSPSLSPDSQRVALQRTVSGNSDIWLLETSRGLLTRFTFDRASDIYPIWSPDGSRIVFGSVRSGGVYNLYQKPVTGAANEELLLATTQNKAVTDWSSDGRFLLYRSPSAKTGFDIWALPMSGPRDAQEQRPFPVVQTNFEERDGQFSPDGKWIAYQSNESGRFEIYIQPFPGPGGKSQISTNGGAQVRWRRDGKELFYIALDGRLMAVPIAPKGDVLQAGTPAPLFATRVGGAVQFDRQQYVISPDGQRFLMNTVMEDASVSPITVILNWKPKP